MPYLFPFQIEHVYWIMLLIVALVVTTEKLRNPRTQWRSRDDQVAWRQREGGR